MAIDLKDQRVLKDRLVKIDRQEEILLATIDQEEHLLQDPAEQEVIQDEMKEAEELRLTTSAPAAHEDKNL